MTKFRVKGCPHEAGQSCVTRRSNEVQSAIRAATGNDVDDRVAEEDAGDDQPGGAGAASSRGRAVSATPTARQSTHRSALPPMTAADA
jgi:hypothetical protein